MRRAQGSIVRYRDGWRAMATVHGIDGQARRVSKVVHGSRKDAERVLKELLAEDRGGRARTFGDICDEYLKDCDRRVKRGELQPKTARDYRTYVESAIKPELGRLREPSLWQVRRMLDGVRVNRRGVHQTLRQVCNFAERNNLMPSNPMRCIDPPAPPRLAGRDEVYSAAEVSTILEALDGEPQWFAAAVAIALGCGLRRGEICALDGADYDGERISVTKAYDRETTKTPSGVRTVAVPTFARALIAPVAPSKPLVAISGVRVSPDSITGRWRRFTASHGIRYLPFKNLRHTSLTLAYEATGDIYAVSRRAGHAGIGITTKYYARPDERIDAGVAEAMGNVLDGE